MVGQNLLTTTSPGNYELAQEVTIGDSYTFSPTLVNTFHVGFNRRRDNRGPTNFPINWTDLGSNMYSAVPNFLLISSMTGGFTTYCGTCAPGHFNLNDFQLADDVNWVKGRHQIGFGFNIIRVQNNTISGFDENGAPTWNGSFTGLGMADFLLGKDQRFPADQRHAGRPADVGDELLCAGQLPRQQALRLELRTPLGTDVLRPR